MTGETSTTPPVAATQVAPASAGSRRRQALCLVVFFVCAVWACWPMGGANTLASTNIKPFIANASAAPTPKRPLDLAAFRAPLWVIPPPPPAAPAPPPPPPPLKLQLIAIISADSTHPTQAALLYDPEQDKLFTVHEGETLQNRTIEKITQAGVHIRDGAGERILTLRSDGAGSSAGTGGGP